MGLLSFEGTLCSSTLFTFLLVSIIHIFYGLLVLHLDSFMFLYISHFCCTTNHDLHSSVLYNAATTVQSSTLSPSHVWSLQISMPQALPEGAGCSVSRRNQFPVWWECLVWKMIMAMDREVSPDPNPLVNGRSCEAFGRPLVVR